MIASYFTGSIDYVVTEHFLSVVTQVITFLCRPAFCVVMAGVYRK